MTLDEQHSFMSNSSLNSVLFRQIHSFEKEDLVSDRSKSRKQTNPQKTIKTFFRKTNSCACKWHSIHTRLLYLLLKKYVSVQLRLNIKI